MAATMLQLTVCAVLLTGALGLPLSSEEKANQFLGLKKQTPLSDYLQLSGNQSNVGEKISETWTALKNTGLQYKELGSSVFSTDTSKDHISSSMDMLQDSGAQLKQPKRTRAIRSTIADICPLCGCRRHGGCHIPLQTQENTDIRQDRDHIMDMLQQSGAHLKQQKRRRAIRIIAGGCAQYKVGQNTQDHISSSKDMQSNLELI